MPGQDFMMEPRDRWPKTEKSIGLIANAIGSTLMMTEIVLFEYLPEKLARALDNTKKLG